MSRSIPYPLKSPLTPGSTTINTWRCTSARSTIPKAFGPSKPTNYSPGPSVGTRCWTGISPRATSAGSTAASSTSAKTAWTAIWPTRGDQVAIIWEGDNPAEDKKITYKQLHQDVCKFANALKDLGVKKGDRVCIYMPMIPETAVAMLACTRIGAVHSIVFGGFSPDSLKDRIIDAECNVVVTSDEGMRGGRKCR
jgi:hypothetical protein